MDFIFILSGLGFPQNMTRWIMEYITNSSFSLSLNGKYHGFFHGKRGLRQGEPISPYLFVLAMDYLSRVLKLYTANLDFNYHPKCSKIDLSHLIFVDDIMIFCRGDYGSVNIIHQALQQFNMIFGLEVNLSKSKIFVAGAFESELTQLQLITGYSLGVCPVRRYLGIPLMHGKLKLAQYASLIDKISNFISSWASNTLSYAGRLNSLRL